MILERDGIRIEDFADLPNGVKHYQVTRKTAHYTHVAVLQFVEPVYQSEIELLRLAKARLNVR